MNDIIQPPIELLATDQPIPVLVGLIVCGMLCCYFGYRTTNFLLDLSGFIFLGLIALMIAGAVTQGNLLVMGIALVVGGVLGLFLAHWVYRLGVMLLGGGIGALLLWHFSDALPSQQWTLPAAVGSGILGGVLALLMQRVIISLGTAVLGSLFIVHGIFLLLAQFEMTPTLPEVGEALSHFAPFALAWAGIAATGFAFQMFFARGKRGKSIGG